LDDGHLGTTSATDTVSSLDHLAAVLEHGHHPLKGSDVGGHVAAGH
jgi:hypothetical protein